MNEKLNLKALGMVLALAVLAACQSAPVVQRDAAPEIVVSKPPAETAIRVEEEREKKKPAAPRRQEALFPSHLNEYYDHLLKSQLYERRLAESAEQTTEYREKVLEELRQAAEANPDSGYVHALMAERLFRSEQVEQARREANLALKKDSAVPLAYRILGAIAWQEKDYPLAIEHLEKALALDETDSRIYLDLGRVYQEKGDSKQANEYLVHAAHFDPDLAGRVYPVIAQNWLLVGDYEQAIEYFEKTIEVLPFPYNIDAYKRMGFAYLQQDQFDKAIETLEKVLAFGLGRDWPGKGDVQVLLAEAYSRSGKFEKAYRTFAQALETDPSQWQARRQLGVLAFYSGRYPEVVEHLSEYLKRNPDDWEVVQLLGVAYTELGEAPQAIALLERLREAGQAGAQTYMILAQLYEDQDQSEKAEQVLLEAVEKGQDKPRLYFSLGLFQYDRRRYEKAEQAFRQALEHAPEHKEAMLYLGLTYDKLDRIDQLEAVMRKAIAVDEEFAEALNLLGYAYADRNMKLEEAERLILRAAELMPNRGFILDSLGWVYYRQGRFEEATLQLEKAAELMGETPDWVVLDHLGDVYQATGRNEDAVRIWQQAIEARRLEPQALPEEIGKDTGQLEEKIEKASN